MLISIPDSALYPDSVSSPTVVYPKVVLTVVFKTVVSSLCDYSSQHSPHSLASISIHVIFISAYPAVQVKLYAYVNMPGRNDLIKITLLFAKGKQSRQPATTRREETNANDSFGKGFHEL